jgi:hypothetical protein
MSQVVHALSLINDGTITSISPHPFPAFPFRQLKPIWAFELAISGISHYDFGLVQSLDQFLTHKYYNKDGSLFHSSWTIEDYYCFVMCDWTATKHILLDTDEIEKYFSWQNLSKPKLIYELNLSGGPIEKYGSVDTVKKASLQLGTEVDSLRQEIEDMQRETKQNFATASQQFQSIHNTMGVLTSSLMTLVMQL